MVKTIAITKARVGLGGLVKDVLKHNSTYILEKDGVETVALVGVEELQDLKDTLEATQRLLREKKRSSRVAHATLKKRYGV